MFKKIIAAGAVSVLFACSSSDPGETTAPSSSGNGSSSSGDGLSSGVEPSSSSEVQLNFGLLQNFEGDLPGNVVGYAFGTATVANDSLVSLDQNDEPILDDNGDTLKYVAWNPDGILTLKDFSFNGGSTTSGENGGGLMVKEIEVKDYSAFRFEVRGTAADFSFRIKVEVPNPEGGEPLSAAWQRRINIESAEEFQIVEINLTGSALSKLYDNTGLGLDRAGAIERAKIVEFSMRADGTIEIDDLEGALLEQ